MPSDIVEKQIDSIADQAERTVGYINVALLTLLFISGVHVFSSAIAIAIHTAFFTLFVNALGLMIVASYFWYLVKKPQFLILSINKQARTERVTKWLHKQTTTKYTLYGLLVLCGSFTAYLIAFFGWAVFVEGGSLLMPDFLLTIFFMGLFFVALIVTFWLGYQASVDITPLHTSVEEPLLHKWINGARGIFPKKVALGSSQNIAFTFNFSDARNYGATLENKNIRDEFVEAELQAAALKVDSDKRIRLCDISSLQTSTWNCHFPAAGVQTLNFIISEVNSARNTRNVIFTFTYMVRIKGALIASLQPLLAITLSMVTLWMSLRSALGGLI
jgi:hypothetical protein